MAFHLTEWQIGRTDSLSFLGRMGIYGVSMFFVLSGLSMAYVYSQYIRDLRTSAIFLVRRIFRIWPLLWMAVLAVTLGKILTHQDPKWTLVLLNITTAFGFISPESYINIGAWSIGNGMVYCANSRYYLCFNRRRLLGNILLVATALVGAIYSFGVLSSQKTLGSQWTAYINPFNNLFLYCAGIAIYYNTKDFKVSQCHVGALFLVSLSLFIFYPAQGDPINVVTGVNGVVFSLASVLLVLAFYKAAFRVPSLLSIALTQLGVVTYGVYLWHPIVYQYTYPVE